MKETSFRSMSFSSRLDSLRSSGEGVCVWGGIYVCMCACVCGGDIRVCVRARVCDIHV